MYEKERKSTTDSYSINTKSSWVKRPTCKSQSLPRHGQCSLILGLVSPPISSTLQAVLPPALVWLDAEPYGAGQYRKMEQLTAFQNLLSVKNFALWHTQFSQYAVSFRHVQSTVNVWGKQSGKKEDARKVATYARSQLSIWCLWSHDGSPSDLEMMGRPLDFSFLICESEWDSDSHQVIRPS